MRRSTKPTQQPAPKARPAVEEFAGLLFEQVPDYVVQRLGPIHAQLADNMRGLDDVRRNNLREALARLSRALPHELEGWNQAFTLAMSHAHEPRFGKLLEKLPEPPAEPPGLWDSLAGQADSSDETGIAACLILYDLGCVRAFVKFRDASRRA
jgi:hypothetical protein